RSLHSIATTKRSYLKERRTDPASLREARRAARFVFLNRFAFNGLYRTNSNGMFNVPYSRSRNGRLPRLEQFRFVASALRNATIRCTDFESLVRRNVRARDLV